MQTTQRPTRVRPKKALALDSVSRDYETTTTAPIHPSDTQLQGVPPKLISSVALHQGALLIDGQPVSGVQYGRNFVRFAEQGPDGVRSGVLNFTPDALAFSGTVMFQHGPAQQVTGAVAPSVYDTQYADPGSVPPAGSSFPTWTPPAPDDASWQAGLQLKIGYQAGVGVPVPVNSVINPATGQEIPLTCTPSVTADNNLQLVLVPQDPSMAGLAVGAIGPLFPAAFTVVVNWDATTFEGVLQFTDPENGYVAQPAEHAWRGTVAQNAKALVMTTERATELGAQRVATTSTPTDLTVAELFGLEPDPSTLQSAQFSMIVDNMKWSLSQQANTSSWLSDFFAQQPPVLDNDRQSLIRKDQAFYNDKFAVGFLGRGLANYAGPGAPTTTLSDAQKTDLDFYLCAGLAAESGYTRQTHGVFLDAFVSVTSRLQVYLQNDPEDWARKLHAALATPAQMNITVTKLIAGEGMEEANRHATILQALQPAGDLAKNYHKRVLAAALGEAVHSLNLDSKEAIGSWLGDSIQAFVTALEQGRLNIPGADPAAQLALTQNAEALREAVLAAGSVAELAGALADVLLSVQGTDIWSKISNAQGKFASMGWKFAGLTYLLAIAGGLYSAVEAFKNWDDLSDTERAQAVVSIVALTAKLVENVPQIVEGVQMTYQTLQDVYSWSRGTLGADLAEAMGDIPFKDGDIFGDGAMAMAEMAGADGEMAVAGTSWVIAFNSTIGMACKFIGVAASVAFATISTIDFVNDFSDGADIESKALDGIVAVANCLAAVCAMAALVIESQVIPVLGAVLAVIGVVATLIELFHHPDPPPSPAEVFVSGTLVPAVPPAPNAWVLPAPNGWAKGDPVPANNSYSPATA